MRGRHTRAHFSRLLGVSSALAFLAVAASGCWAAHDPDASPCGPCATECCDFDFTTGRTVAPFCVPPMRTCREAPPIDAGFVVTDASTVADAGTDAPAPIDCSLPAPVDRSCASDADCTMLHHYLDCCGTDAWTGVRVDAADEASAYFTACEAEFPACGCAARPTPADDGSDVNAPGSYLHVTCAAGSCRTSYVGTR